jgi:hypothetical protein
VFYKEGDKGGELKLIERAKYSKNLFVSLPGGFLN